MKKVSLILGVHNHQPVGNFGQVFEALFRQSYEPFLKILYRYPKVKFTVHTTGPLLEWMEENQPGYLKLLGEMVKRGQIEFFTGGMYEPNLSILPDRDKLGQVRLLTDYLEKEIQGACSRHVAGGTGLGTAFDQVLSRSRGEIYRDG